jgi:hypothetical protein
VRVRRWGNGSGSATALACHDLVRAEAGVARGERALGVGAVVDKELGRHWLAGAARLGDDPRRAAGSGRPLGERLEAATGDRDPPSSTASVGSAMLRGEGGHAISSGVDIGAR